MTVGSWLHGSEVGERDLTELREKLYFDLEPGSKAYVRFGILIVLSVIIATGGVMSDSTATVIGAMIVAPLMTPIVATALAVVTGDAVRIGRSFAIVLAGVATAIGLSWLIVVASVSIIDVDTNSQITARTNPQLLDLMVALASGAAGAIALSRRDVGDTLPGVAISISLVPPLCVVGTGLAVGSATTASGAMLLFTTNLMAILVAGGILLAVMGYGAIALEEVHRAKKRRAIALIVIATLAILSPLAVHTVSATRSELLQRRTTNAAEQWLEEAGGDYRLVRVTVNGEDAQVVIAGVGDAPDIDGLVAILGDDVPSGLDVEAVQSEDQSIGDAGS